ncbi:ANTAR domain-containing protein [Streptomyces daliensis]|uniref:ANTAR domain-containing protein n=1 Tax=Streptomyces daliensis TaxID=299421 RepID=A0A8T4IUL4_9ACTN|nr:ANTAR domain-containing protein [Streptomyces daliensis]
MTPELRLADAFVALAGDMAEGPPDVAETLSVLAHRAPGLLDATAASVLFSPDGPDRTGDEGAGAGTAPQVAGSDPEVTRLERDALGWREGPGHDCRRERARAPEPGRRARDGRGARIAQSALDEGPVMRRWPRYARRALDLGYARVAAVPLVTRTGAGGALVLLSGSREGFSGDTLALGQSLADFTSVLLERVREAESGRLLTSQLEHALTSRVLIEQAKGVLATMRAVPLGEAFELLRKHARSRQRPMRDVAREIVEGHAVPGLTGPGTGTGTGR